MTEQDKIKFKQDYFEADGIRLENVEKNKGMRAIAKIMFNTLGKTGTARKYDQDRIYLRIFQIF